MCHNVTVNIRLFSFTVDQLATVIFAARYCVQKFASKMLYSVRCEVVADSGVVDVNSDVHGRIQNILTEGGFRI